jgi:transcriptional regulator with XRE-family HTH domain
MSTPLVSSSQIRAARHLANLSQSAIAKATGLSLPTIRRAESEREVSVSDEAIAAIGAALEAAGVIFVEENGEGPGVRLRKDRKPMSEPLRTGTFVKFSSAIKPPDEKYSGQTGIVIAPDPVAGDPSKDWVRWNDGYECAYPSGTLTRV